MFEFLKTKNFHMLFSFLLGIFVVIIWRPVCEKEDCIKRELPNLNEINNSTYQIGTKCYQFRTNILSK
jgi:hypothetical protein